MVKKSRIHIMANIIIIGGANLYFIIKEKNN